ncbi:MAG: PfkB family carbohydrate kinase [Spirochaetia bacterium]|nr:PfkB family carbohydrate kinase [Spirochaetia bacterium]
MKKKYNIVSIGHVTNDVRNMMGKKTPFVGGAAYFSPHAAKRSGADVLVITKMAEKDRHTLSTLTDAGIDVLPLPSKATTSIENIFVTEDQDNRKLKLISLADSFSADEIPDDIKADVFHIAALFHGEVPDEMIKSLSKRGKIAFDLQAALRYIGEDDVYFEDWKEKEKYLPFVHYIKADSLEIKVITGTDDREKAAKILFGWGGKEIVITRKDEVLVYDGKNFYHAPFNAKNLDGRAGRGDTCFLSYITRRFTHGPDEAAHYAAALTSIKMEKPAPFSGTLQDVLDRMKTQAY